MSADAKAWSDETGYFWSGCHDACPAPDTHCDRPLAEVLAGIDQCAKCSMRWIIRLYPSGKTGLAGYGY